MTFIIDNVAQKQIKQPRYLESSQNESIARFHRIAA